MNLNQVTVNVSDVEASFSFYKKLGLIPIVKSLHYARFECPAGDSTFSIHHSDDTVLAGQTAIYFETADLDSTVARLMASGIEFIHTPIDQKWLWRESRLKDPDGHLIILYYAAENRKDPPWKISS